MRKQQWTRNGRSSKRFQLGCWFCKERKGDGQGDGVPKACPPTGGGGLARVPNLRVCKTPLCSGGTRTEGRANQRPAVVSTSSEMQGGKTGPARLRGRHVVRGRQSSPIPECARITGIAGENGLYAGTGAAAHPGQDCRHPSVVTHLEP